MPAAVRTPLLALALGFGMICGLTPAAAPAEPVAAAGRDLLEEGLLLLGERNCTSCHAAGPALSRQLLPKQAPILDQVGSRVRLTYLRAFLSDPRAIQPSTTMPHVLGSLPPEQQAAAIEALVHFLATTASDPDKPAVSGSVATGETLYHQIGCAVCHGRRDIAAPRATAELLPLGDLTTKYTSASLAAFLKDPLAVRPSGRMPALSLVKNEASDLAAYLLEDRSAADPAFAVDRELAVQGRALFATVGCASCHTLRDRSGPVATALSAPPLDQLAAEPRGCLAPGDAPRGLLYRLDGHQRDALLALLKAIRQGSLPAPAPRQVVDRTLETFRCYSCHLRNGRGGVEEARQELFTTTQKEMGDEGRIPPSLDGVGAKLEPGYIKRYLDVGVKDRPYMLTRMPRFGAANVGGLIAALAALDPLEPVAVPPFAVSPRLVKSAGRFLAGGEALGCIKCHSFKGIEPEGVQAIDLTVLTRRLRHDWFHRYLVDTQAFRPGTRMPTAWPNGQTLLPQVLEGDTPRQIEALWQFLADGSAADEPAGVGREPMPLVPASEPIIYRNFIKGAGPRAIGVGYPEHASLAFDANELGIALIWQGAFIDASRHWSTRGGGFPPPLGENVITLPAGPSFAVLPSAGSPWPRGPAKDHAGSFRGYRLTHDGRPTFLYDVAGAHVADFPDAVATTNPKAPTLRRTLTITGPPPPRPLWFRAIAAGRVEPLGDGWYAIDGEWKLRLRSAGQAILRTSEGKTELLVPVPLDGAQETQIVHEFVW